VKLETPVLLVLSDPLAQQVQQVLGAPKGKKVFRVKLDIRGYLVLKVRSVSLVLLEVRRVRLELALQVLPVLLVLVELPFTVLWPTWIRTITIPFISREI
jgi:hypothetical protein